MDANIQVFMYSCIRDYLNTCIIVRLYTIVELYTLMQAVAIAGDPGAMLALLALFQAGNMAGIMRIACNGVFRVSMAFFNVQCVVIH